MDTIALILSIIGSLNWGLVGIFQFDLVAWLFGGQDAVISRIVYSLVGLAGLFKQKVKMLPAAALVGGVARFVIHYISGFTVYAKWMPEEFMGMPMTSPFIYSALYNGGYMLPCTILAVVVCALLITAKPIRNWISGDDLK